MLKTSDPAIETVARTVGDVECGVAVAAERLLADTCREPGQAVAEDEQVIGQAEARRSVGVVVLMRTFQRPTQLGEIALQGNAAGPACAFGTHGIGRQGQVIHQVVVDGQGA